MEFDVVVVGSGAAGCAAAISAASEGAEVAVLERSAVTGGTTALSAGAYWVPNNSQMRALGLDDPQPAALRFMARMAQPALYDAVDEHLGLTGEELALLQALYDHSAPVVDSLTKLGALNPMMWPTLGFSDSDVTDPDYHAGIPENESPFGHLLMPTLPADFDVSAQLPGTVLAAEMVHSARQLGVTVLTEHRVRELLCEADAVVGVACENESGIRRIRANGGVVFATGGFAHNSSKAQSFLRGPIFGSGSCVGSTGDFIDLATSAGAGLGNMTNAWWCQVVLDAAVSSGGLVDASGIVFVPYGDSMVIVNTRGVRVCDEKAMYNERTQSHFVTDGLGWPNLVQIMIWDQAVAADPAPWPWRGGVPLPGQEPTWLIQADDLSGLARAVERRLSELSGRRGISARVGADVRLAEDFDINLSRTIAGFNTAAANGVDPEFGRGSTPVSRAWSGPIRRGANPTMHPLSPSGPYYALILVAGTLDTCGGPTIDATAAVVRPDGSPIAGLFGAGNCVAAPTGQGYLGGGGTIGPALTFGWIAGRTAATRGRGHPGADSSHRQLAGR
jgi:3-oxosteroid 1-dehydrogenase